MERLKNFSDFAEQNPDGEAGKFFSALSSAFKLIAPKRNPSYKSNGAKRRDDFYEA